MTSLVFLSHSPRQNGLVPSHLQSLAALASGTNIFWVLETVNRPVMTPMTETAIQNQHTLQPLFPDDPITRLILALLARSQTMNFPRFIEINK